MSVTAKNRAYILIMWSPPNLGRLSCPKGVTISEVPPSESRKCYQGNETCAMNSPDDVTELTWLSVKCIQ